MKEKEAEEATLARVAAERKVEKVEARRAEAEEALAKERETVEAAEKESADLKATIARLKAVDVSWFQAEAVAKYRSATLVPAITKMQRMSLDKGITEGFRRGLKQVSRLHPELAAELSMVVLEDEEEDEDEEEAKGEAGAEQAQATEDDTGADGGHE